MKEIGWVLILLSLAVFLSIKTGKLNTAGALVGGLIGLFVFFGAGYTGIALLGTFFTLASLATSWKLNIKEQLRLAENHKGKRKAGQVMANGGVAGLLGLFIFLYPVHADCGRLMMAASLASATADTVSSEMGIVQGSKFFNILSLKKDIRGLNGVVSVEGTVFGLLGSIAIAAVYTTGFGWNIHFLWIVLAGTFGNFFDSLLGATLERRGMLGNDGVNFLNTAFAALFTLFMDILFS